MMLILAGYLGVSTGRLTGQSPSFQWMNIAGAVGFVINSGYHHAVPSAALNVIWLMIGVFALWRISKSGSSTSAM